LMPFALICLELVVLLDISRRLRAASITSGLLSSS
jgi:hypothetical protein